MTEPASREGQHRGTFLVNGRDEVPADQKIADGKYVDEIRCSCGKQWVILEPTRCPVEENHQRAKATLAQHQAEELAKLQQN